MKPPPIISHISYRCGYCVIMGNQNSDLIQQETENFPNGRSENVVGTTMQSQYGSVNNNTASDLPLPIQRQEEGKLHQSRLVTAASRNIPFVSFVIPNSRLKPCERFCRLIFFTLCAFLFLGTLVLFIVLTVVPQGYSNQVTVQRSQTVVLSRVDTYYYNFEVSKSDDSSFNVHIGTVPCSSLVTHSITVPTTWHYGREANGYDIQRLKAINQFAYLVSGSVINIYINITNQPTTDDKIYLYIFTDFEKYSKNQLHSFFDCFEIDSQKNHFSFNIDVTGFYFYTLALPNGTNYIYGYDVKRMFYNSSDFDLSSCLLSSKSPACQFHLNSSTLPNINELCIVSNCTSLEGTSDDFYHITLQLIRKSLNTFNCLLLIMAIIFLILTVGILVYDFYRQHCDPKLTTYDNCICKKKSCCITN